MEGGAASLALSSGTAACFYSIINMAESGDNFVSAQNLYGGTFTQVRRVALWAEFAFRGIAVLAFCAMMSHQKRRRESRPFSAFVFCLASLARYGVSSPSPS